MSRKGDPYDNAVTENFFSCLKCELVHLHHSAFFAFSCPVFREVLNKQLQSSDTQLRGFSAQLGKCEDFNSFFCYTSFQNEDRCIQVYAGRARN